MILFEGYRIRTKEPEKVREIIDEEIKKCEDTLKVLKNIIIEGEYEET